MAEQVCKCVVSVPHWPEGKPICQMCGLSLNDGARPAEPSAAGETPTKCPCPDSCDHSEMCLKDCAEGFVMDGFQQTPGKPGYDPTFGGKIERGNQPQATSGGSVQLHQAMSQIVIGTPTIQVSNESSKAPGVAAEPLSCAECETPVCEHVARDVADLRRQLEQEKDEHGRLQRTVKFMEETYLREHGGSWGKCKYQAQAEAAEQKEGWVSVLERMPTKAEQESNGKWWLVANGETGRRDVAMLVKGEDFMGMALQFKEVTHWRSLPAPPSTPAPRWDAKGTYTDAAPENGGKDK